MFPLLLVLGTAPGAGSEHPPIQPDLPPPQCAPATPTWDRMFPASGLCAGRGLQPFDLQPRVCGVKVCGCDPETEDSVKNRAWVKEFHTPAFVPYPRFDITGRPVPGDGVLIYEGMRLAVDPITGKYDLTFTATVPAMPVNLRLQLVFLENKQTDVQDPVTGKWIKVPAQDAGRYTLTLPPIRMEPPRDAQPGDPTPRTFHIAHRGYSSLFLDLSKLFPGAKEFAPSTQIKTDRPCGTDGPITCSWTVSRVGTARFGTPIAIDDPNR